MAVWCGDEILLVKNSYKTRYTLPSGGVDRGETICAAAVRELREEVGIATTEDQLKLIKEFRSTSEFKTDLSTVYELTVETKPATRIDGVEITEAEFIPFDRIRSRKLVSILDQYVDWKMASQ